MKRLSKISRLLKVCKHIAIIGHIDPDGDALASMLAIKTFIEQNYARKEVNLFADGTINDLYKPILNGVQLNKNAKKFHDLVISVDCTNDDRMGKYKSVAKKLSARINIDHHLNNDQKGNVNVVVPRASSTGEILFYLLNELCLKFTADVAKLLYVAILTDTNCFTSLSTTSRTHKVVAQLLAYNFDYESIRNYFFKNNTKSKAFLLQKALKSLKFYFNDRISYMKLTKADFENTDGEFTDSYGIIDQGINISGVNISYLIIEKDENEYYVSIRSKGDIDVSEVATQLGGGGHKNMAGLTYKGDLKELINTLNKEYAKLLSTLPPDNIEPDFVF